MNGKIALNTFRIDKIHSKYRDHAHHPAQYQTTIAKHLHRQPVECDHSFPFNELDCHLSSKHKQIITKRPYPSSDLIHFSIPTIGLSSRICAVAPLCRRFGALSMQHSKDAQTRL